MRKIWYVALNDLRVSFAEPGIWINLVVIPCVLIFIIGLANGGFGGTPETPTYRVDVLDNDSSALSTQFLDDLTASNPNLILCPLADDTDDVCRLGTEPLTAERAITRLENNETSAALEIPLGFGENALTGDPAEIVYRSSEQPGQPSLILQAVQAAVQRVAGSSIAARVAVTVYEDSGMPTTFADEADRQAFEQAVYDRASGIWSGLPPAVAYVPSSATQSDGGQTSGFQQSVPGMGSMYVMFTVLAGAFILLRERKDWTLQRLVMMPVRRGEVIGGKMLARFIMGMIQFTVAFGFGALALRANFGNNLPALVLVMMAFTACMAALAYLLATFVQSETQASSVITLMALTLAPLGGAWWPLEIVPDWMRTVGHLSPVAWAMDGFSTLIYRNGGLTDVLLPVAVLTGAAVVLFALATSRFKYE